MTQDRRAIQIGRAFTAFRAKRAGRRQPRGSRSRAVSDHRSVGIVRWLWRGIPGAQAAPYAHAGWRDDRM